MNQNQPKAPTLGEQIEALHIWHNAVLLCQKESAAAIAAAGNARIAELEAWNRALTDKVNGYVIANARLAERAEKAEAEVVALHSEIDGLHKRLSAPVGAEPDVWRVSDGEGGYFYHDSEPSQELFDWYRQRGREFEKLFDGYAISTLQARLAAAEGDAERYKWLRDVGTKTWVPLQQQWRVESPPDCDRIIDAARSADTGEGKN
jgi:hypothetical protein